MQQPHLQARQVGLTFAKRMMPPEAVDGVATLMLRVWAPAAAMMAAAAAAAVLGQYEGHTIMRQKAMDGVAMLMLRDKPAAAAAAG
jgi:hypothetical protein